jgi:hypothetical protein
LLAPHVRRDRPVVQEYYRPVQAMQKLAQLATPQELQRLRRYDRRLKAITADGWKLIWGDDGTRELYDLQNDPTEAHDRATEQVARRDALAARLGKLILSYDSSSNHGRSMPPADPASTAALRSLGYVE